MDTTWKLRLSEGELESWKACAAGDGKLLSEWIRELCNGEVEAHRVSDVSRTRKVRKDAGRESVPGRSVEKLPVCANCDHKKSRHRDAKGVCQEDNCLCGSFV
jgi:hypothetical protein